MSVLVRDTSGFELDYETQRFVSERWDTEQGELAIREIIEGIKNNVEIRGILDDYVLDWDHPYSTYAYPYYPKEKIHDGHFWLLNNDDLRGIKIFRQEFEDSRSLERKSLAYSAFYNVKFKNMNIHPLDMSQSSFFNCTFDGCNLYQFSGFNILFKDCDFKNSTFISCYWHGARIYNSSIAGARIGEFGLKDCELDHLSRFDDDVVFVEYEGKSEPDFATDFYRDLRIAYEKAEIFPLLDRCFLKEQVSRRKFILWPRVRKDRSVKAFSRWLVDYIWSCVSGYGTKPFRLILSSLLISMGYSLVYWQSGTPFSGKQVGPGLLECVYFSFTAFATLGFGDLSYDESSPWLRLLSTSEAWCGAIFLALFVAVMARKLMR
ncbi:MAG: ion channel [Rhodospirillales bacterium]